MSTCYVYWSHLIHFVERLSSVQINLLNKSHVIFLQTFYSSNFKLNSFINMNLLLFFLVWFYVCSADEKLKSLKIIDSLFLSLLILSLCVFAAYVCVVYIDRFIFNWHDTFFVRFHLTFILLRFYLYTI